jgi:hypothetical protein
MNKQVIEETKIMVHLWTCNVHYDNLVPETEKISKIFVDVLQSGL